VTLIYCIEPEFQGSLAHRQMAARSVRIQVGDEALKASQLLNKIPEPPAW
jgi:hypothetical protein